MHVFGDGVGEVLYRGGGVVNWEFDGTVVEVDGEVVKRLEVGRRGTAIVGVVTLGEDLFIVGEVVRRKR